MPLTYHFRPFPDPKELRSEPKIQSTSTEPSMTTCPCGKSVTRCQQCRQQKREQRFAPSRYSQTTMPSIKEESDPIQRALTFKERREQRRAASHTSVGAAFHELLGSEDYFTFYHDTAFARSPSASPRSAYRSSRAAIRSRSSGAEQAGLPSVPTPLEASDSSDSIHSVDSVESADEKDQDLSRRGS